MEAKIDALIKEVSALRNENIEIRSQIAEMKSRMNHENEEEEEDDHDDHETGFLCFRSKPKRNVAPPGRTTHPTRGKGGDDDEADIGAPGATTHPSRGNKKPLPVFKPKHTEITSTPESKPEYSQV
jgi:hypothetical protein